MEFSELVKTEREKKYNSAREFHRRTGLNCSYFYYSKIESGTVPEIELALSIINLLGINLRKAITLWAQSQMPTPESKAVFSSIGNSHLPQEQSLNITTTVGINRLQSELLRKNPIYWELLAFIGCTKKSGFPKTNNLSNQFGISESSIEKYLSDLFEHSLIDKNKNGSYVSKDWFFLPYEAEFDKIRDQNFYRAVAQFKSQHDIKNKYRNTLTRALSEKQLTEVSSLIDNIINHIVAMPDESNLPGAEIYTFGLFISKRLFGEKK